MQKPVEQERKCQTRGHEGAKGMNSRRWEVERNQRGSEEGHGLSPLTPGVVTKSQHVQSAPGVALTSWSYRGVRRLRGILKAALGSTMCSPFNSPNPLSLTPGAILAEEGPAVRRRAWNWTAWTPPFLQRCWQVSMKADNGKSPGCLFLSVSRKALSPESPECVSGVGGCVCDWEKDRD